MCRIKIIINGANKGQLEIELISKPNQNLNKTSEFQNCANDLFDGHIHYLHNVILFIIIWVMGNYKK